MTTLAYHWDHSSLYNANDLCINTVLTLFLPFPSSACTLCPVHQHVLHNPGFLLTTA